jgi:hypothetical protein
VVCHLVCANTAGLCALNDRSARNITLNSGEEEKLGVKIHVYVCIKET